MWVQTKESNGVTLFWNCWVNQFLVMFLWMRQCLQFCSCIPTPVPHPPKLKVQPIALAKYIWAFPHLVALPPAVWKKESWLIRSPLVQHIPCGTNNWWFSYLFTRLSKHAEKFIDHCCEEYKQWPRQNMDLLTQFLQAGNFKILGQDGLFTSSCFLSYSVIFVLVSVIFLIWMQIWNQSHCLFI